MPRRSDLKRVLVIGSGPIVIGQACEFDYSGTQACKALRSEGLEVILMNSNPATIMTDPDAADRTYVEPLTWEYARAVIEKERPDALLPTVGGQTALNNEDLEEQRKAFLKKLFKNRPLCEMSLGNKMVLDRFLDHFLNTFLTKLIFFDALVTW